jgi:hypothetical protein
MSPGLRGSQWKHSRRVLDATVERQASALRLQVPEHPLHPAPARPEEQSASSAPLILEQR